MKQQPAEVLAKFESKSSPGTFHEIRRSRRDGVIYCTCRGWISHKHCTHLTKFAKGQVAKKPVTAKPFTTVQLLPKVAEPPVPQVAKEVRPRVDTVRQKRRIRLE